MEKLYIIAILLLLYSTLTNKLKKSTVFFSLIIIILLNIGIKNTWDIYNYYRKYLTLNEIDFSKEIGFQVIILLFKTFNADFFTFRITMLIISLILMIISIKRINKNISFFMLIYMLYFALMDVEQIRNFYAIIILFLAFKYLFDNSSLSTIKYIIMVCLASSIHTAFILYLLLLLVKSKLDITKVILKLLPMLTILLAILIKYTNIQQIIISLIEDGRNEYLNLKTNFGWIIPTSIYVYNIFLIKYCYSLIKGKETYYKIKKYSLKKATIIKNIESIRMDYIWKNLYLINIIGLLFIPLYMNSLVFYRLNKNIILINIIFINSIYNYQRELKTKYISILFLTFILIVGYWIFDFNIYSSWETFYNCYFVDRLKDSII